MEVSRATATILLVPLDVAVLFHSIAYGELVSSLPTKVPLM